jgi:hypothetical protein
VAESPLQRSPVGADRRLAGRYRLERLVAHGGMATVWLATDEHLRRPVAVKLLHEHLRDPLSLERFRAEGKLAAQLSHPGIVAIYDTFHDHGVDGIVLEYVDGTTLRERLDTGPVLPREAVRIARQLAAALATAHARGLVHRDIKPANVLLDRRGTVKLTDFGIAKLLDATDLTQPGTYVGTAKYLAPEQVTGEPSDGRVDVYALGVVLYEMLAGTAPFSGDTDAATALARLQLPAPPLQRRRSDLAPALTDLVDRMLERAPARRPTMRDVIAALDALEPVAEPSLTSPLPRPRRRVPLALVVVGVVMVAALVVAIALVRTTDAGRRLFGGDGSATTAATPIALDTARLESFDPFGDQVEHEELLGFLHDGNDRTVWTTERYASSTFGGLKKGLGVIVDLGRTTSVSQLEVRGASTGWSAVVYVADGSPDALASWGNHVAQRSAVNGAATFTFAPTRGRTVLLWITDLGDASQVRIGELVIRGPA